VRAAEQLRTEAEDATDGSQLDGEAVSMPDLAAIGWLHTRMPNPAARLRLYCFPSALGRQPATCFWDSRIAGEVEICLIEPPAWSPGQAPGIAAQAEALAGALALHIDQPFAFFGHCTGAILMYEVARRLRRDHDLHPAHMFTSGSAAPHLYVMPNAHLLPDEKIIEVLDVIGHPLAQSLALDGARRQALMPAIRADFEIMAGYRYHPESPLSCPITAFRSRGDLWAYFYGTEAWREHTQGSFEVVTQPGDHFFIERDPTLVIDTVARALGLDAPAERVEQHVHSPFTSAAFG
jgi:medium-chain acyl-[acyl-carrier-protein] hydrolase